MDDLFAWRLNGSQKKRRAYPYVGNQCDGDNLPSLLVSQEVLLDVGIRHVDPDGADMGGPFEIAVRQDLETELNRLDPTRGWILDNGRNVSGFVQYHHLDVLDAAVKANVDLRTEFGRDYRISPDVTIGVPQRHGNDLWLHAVVSCKWSMRSDRVQNVRPEGATLVRHRRGRAPHFVVVTAEPLAGRISAIAMTTGEVDAVYHVAFEETARALHANGTKYQIDTWDEMVAQNRLRDYNTLAETIALT
jgi:hypothetical protein